MNTIILHLFYLSPDWPPNEADRVLHGGRGPFQPPDGQPQQHGRGRKDPLGCSLLSGHSQNN
jgi:hypothetical protein